MIIEEIDKNKNKKVFIMKLDRRILENIVSGKYDKYDMGDEQKWNTQKIKILKQDLIKYKNFLIAVIFIFYEQFRSLKQFVIGYFTLCFFDSI